MKFWLVLTLVLGVEEYTSMAVSLTQAHHLGLNTWAIHGIWLGTVIIDTVIGFKLGRWAQASVLPRSWEQNIKKWLTLLERLTGKFGEKLGLILVQLFVTSYMSGFIASWLTMSFSQILALTIIGELISYTLIWAGVLGTIAVTHSFKIAIVLAATFALFCIIVLRRLRKMLQ